MEGTIGLYVVITSARKRSSCGASTAMRWKKLEGSDVFNSQPPHSHLTATYSAVIS